ncbi:MAG: flavodoxin family protein [Thermoplasmata archaeon]
MKVVAFNGSPRPEGNTAFCIKLMFDVLKEHGIQTELIQVGGNLIHGCRACLGCKGKGRCTIEDDIINNCIIKMKDADGIIIGSPTYFSDVTSETKALIDRAGYVSRQNSNFLRRKVGCAVAVNRRAGGNNVFSTINYFFLINEMIVPGSTYWNLGVGRAIGDCEKDKEGIDTFRNLAENMAWLLNTLNSR